METNHAPASAPETEVLEELAAYINDSKLGYEKASQNAVNPDHQTIYRQLTEQRTSFLQELNGYIRQQGGQTEKSRVITDELYQQWVDSSASATVGDDETLVLASLKGEEWALQAYKRVLDNQQLSAATRQLLDPQKQAILAAQSQLGGMRLSS